MVNTKDNIWIEGFPVEHAFRSRMYGASGISSNVTLIYEGKTSEIPEEVAMECAHEGLLTCKYRDYKTGYNTKETAREAIQSACPEDWCIIYRK